MITLSHTEPPLLYEVTQRTLTVSTTTSNVTARHQGQNRKFRAG